MCERRKCLNKDFDVGEISAKLSIYRTSMISLFASYRIVKY